jgi:hypothetical protein
MAVKIDKEAILKHRFWIMLGVAVPLIVVAMYVLRIDIASGIEKSKKAADTLLKSIKTVGGEFPSQEQIDKLGAEVKKANAEVTNVWARVFREQAPYLTWPEEFEKIHPFANGKFIREIKETTEKESADPNHFIGVLIEDKGNFIRVKGSKDGKEDRFYRTESYDKQFRGLGRSKTYDIYFQTARYFNDPLHDGEQADYDKYYLEQIRSILDIVDPINVDGVGVVQLGHGPAGWQAPREADDPDHRPPSAQEAAVARYLRWVPKWNTAVNISEEAWMAQEDLWIQKEIYENIRNANDQVGKMLGAEVEGKDKTATFKNPYFEIRLTLLGQNKLKVTLKNLRDNRQKLDIAFRIRMTKDTKQKWDTINVQGEPLDPVGTKGKGSDTMTKELTLDNGSPRTGIYEVEQVLTWETAAVRRIDHIAIGSSSVDDMSMNHRQFPDGVRPLVPPPVEKQEEGDNKQRPMRGDMDKKTSLTINGLVKDRYLEVNDQARRLPVGVAIIVDQMHLGRILKAFENSKFRFVINQTLLNRYPLSLRPVIAAANKDDAPRPVQPFRGFFPQGPGGPGRHRMMPFPMGAGAGGEETFESNVELVIYGTMTLYQRYPPRPAAGQAAEVAAKE